MVASQEGDMWILNGELGRASDSIIKAAVTIEDDNPSAAIEYAMQVGNTETTDWSTPQQTPQRTRSCPTWNGS